MVIITPPRAVRRIRLLPWITACTILIGVNASRGSEIEVTFAMHSDPVLDVPAPESRLHQALAPLWRQALARPEAEFQLGVCDSIVQAHIEGFTGMNAFEPDLLRVLSEESTGPAVRFAAARALIALDARNASEPLLHVARESGGEFRSLIEPVLAARSYAPAKEMWFNRLSAAATRRRDLILAAECSARIGDSNALPRLVELALSPERSPDIRLATARAAGAIAETGLEDEAESLAAATSIVDRLCAVALLTRHTSPPAQEILAKLGDDEEPSIAAASLAVLFSIDPSLVLPLAPQALNSDDANVRLWAAESYIALPTPERVAALSALLDDPHPHVRVTVRDGLLAHSADPELDAPVRESTMEVLAGDSWRGHEQAALLLATLDHKAAAPRMVELLEADRHEVMIATAWGLRILSIPETAPAILDVAARQVNGRIGGTVDLRSVDRQMAHLFEALGLLHYRPAASVMRQYIPKHPARGELSRSAAIWALGHIHAGEANEDLAEQFMGRATDQSLEPPEYELVQAMSVVSIARMQAESQLNGLQDLVGPVTDHFLLDYATGWAIRQMTGEEIPLAPPIVHVRTGWFLEPLRE